ncbi:MAG: ATP-binding cassette domain-containing protein [Clostridium sp.]|nr:ATP-binding cassette domain-containing protein [Clostridium sp.]
MDTSKVLFSQHSNSAVNFYKNGNLKYYLLGKPDNYNLLIYNVKEEKGDSIYLPYEGYRSERNIEEHKDYKKDLEENMEEVFERFSRLKERRRQLAGTLSGGEQQMLAVGRALMAKPSMILMDEPSMGLSPLLVKEIFSIIKEVNRKGITVLLVEQNAKMALSISSRAYVMETGKITISGDAGELLRDDRVRKAYLGQ